MSFISPICSGKRRVQKCFPVASDGRALTLSAASAYKLLSIARRHGAELVDQACARALQLQVIDVYLTGQRLSA